MKSFEVLALLYENYIKGLDYRDNTVEFQGYVLNRFFTRLREREINSVCDVTADDICGFVEYLMQCPSRLHKPYSKGTVERMYCCVRNFFRFLYRHDLLLTNPAEMLDITIRGIETKREIFTGEEINLFLDSIDLTAIHGERDKALFELMYSSGLRISEAERLNISDVDLSERILIVKMGKGSKDRYVPFSEVAQKFLLKYMESERKHFVRYIHTDAQRALFLSYWGRITIRAIRTQFMKNCKETGIERKGLTVHSIRHTTATHLLQAGADVRYVAELLGHEDIETTVRYTHLLMDNLKRAYKSAHPRENEYYMDIDSDYLQQLEQLKKDIDKRRQINEQYR